MNLQKLVRSVPVGDYVKRIRGPPGPGDAAEGRRRRRTFVRKMVDWGAGPRAGHVPDPGRPGDGRDGRPLQRGHRRHQEGGHPRAAPPHQHQLPGPGRRARRARTSCSSCSRPSAIPNRRNTRRRSSLRAAASDRRCSDTGGLTPRLAGRGVLDSPWYRVFGASAATIEPAALLEHLHGQRSAGPRPLPRRRSGLVPCRVAPRRGRCAGRPGTLPRRRRGTSGRAEFLGGLAGGAGGQSAPSVADGRLIGTAQVFTLQLAEDEGDEHSPAERLELTCCRYLAAAGDGVYQVDRLGFFAADGTLLVPESP